jgi:hypothetical protein
MLHSTGIAAGYFDFCQVALRAARKKHPRDTQGSPGSQKTAQNLPMTHQALPRGFKSTPRTRPQDSPGLQKSKMPKNSVRHFCFLSPKNKMPEDSVWHLAFWGPWGVFWGVSGVPFGNLGYLSDDPWGPWGPWGPWALFLGGPWGAFQGPFKLTMMITC